MQFLEHILYIWATTKNFSISRKEKKNYTKIKMLSCLDFLTIFFFQIATIINIHEMQFKLKIIKESSCGLCLVEPAVMQFLQNKRIENLRR
jgi:hypothetical protein